MKDRVPTYPGRVTLTPVPGQANTYDMVRADQPTQEGTPINKASFLPDAVASEYFVNPTGNETVGQVLGILPNIVWREVARFPTAGAFNWTVPEDGTYGALIVGGGGSGGFESYNSGCYAYGGNSGKSICITRNLTEEIGRAHV